MLSEEIFHFWYFDLVRDNEAQTHTHTHTRQQNFPLPVGARRCVCVCVRVCVLCVWVCVCVCVRGLESCQSLSRCRARREKCTYAECLTQVKEGNYLDSVEGMEGGGGGGSEGFLDT